MKTSEKWLRRMLSISGDAEAEAGGGSEELKAPFPHCDQRVLHEPGKCVHCDTYPEWQQLRKDWGIAFTGNDPVVKQPHWNELPCPSDFNRGKAGAHVWGGNRPAGS